MYEESASFIPSIWASMNSWCTPAVLFVFLNVMIGTIAITSSLASTQKGNEQQKQQQQQYQYQEQYATSPPVLQRLKSINLFNYGFPEPNTDFAQTQGMDAHSTYHFNYEQERERERDQEHQPPQLSRTLSMLQRLKFINLYNFMSQESTTLHKTQETDNHYSPNQVHEEEKEHHQEAEEKAEQQPKEEEEYDYIQDQEQTLDETYSQLKGSNVSRTKSDSKPASGEIPKKQPKKMRKSASSKSAFSHYKVEDIVEIESRRPATVRETGNAKMTEVDDEEVDAKADDFINKFKHKLKQERMDSISRHREMINGRIGK